MNNSISQNDYDAIQISCAISTFFHRFQIAKILKRSNAKKEKGISPVQIFEYAFSLVFKGKFMFMDLLKQTASTSFQGTLTLFNCEV